jgi:V/A-type H+/Na+-transporting ATPase subunit I
MGQAKLMKGTIIIPRMETQEAVSRLAELEWFHLLPSTSSSEHLNPYLDDLLLRAQKLFQDTDEVVRALGIPLETGVMDTMFKGAPKGKTDYAIDNIQNFIADLEDKSKALLYEPKKILLEQNKLSKLIEEYSAIEAALKMAATINLDLSSFRQLKRFYSDIFIIDSKDAEEIKMSLGDLPLYTNKLDEQKSSLVVFSSSEDSERVIKVLRSFGVHPLQIPPDMPQNPSATYAQAKSKLKELQLKATENTKNINKIIKSPTTLTKILSLHEATKLAKDILEVTRKPGGTKNFAIIQGYIPKQMEKKFKDLTHDYISLIEDTTVDGHSERSDALPTLLTNKSYTRTFEVITETQGIPRHDEVDPTPIIAFVWPLFYGLMFADLGHGLLLFGLGMLIRQRGNGTLRTWGTLVAASGAAAALAGLATGEFFGFHILELPVLSDLAAKSHIIGVLNVSELTFDQVVKILKVSIAIGIVHLLLAFFLRLQKNIKDGNKLFVLTHDIPSIIQFLAIVALMLAAIGSGYDIIGMFGITGQVHNEPVPWLTFIFGDWVTVNVVAKAMPPVIFATIGIMIYGGWKEQKLAAKHGHGGEGGGFMGIVIEVILVRITEVLSNVISYARIGIMLLVHAALLVTVNQSFTHGGGYAVLIGGNIGVMLIEGLIVYIQTIRLHLYEWFPKWYVGEGIEFKKLIPKMLYSNLIWKDNNNNNQIQGKSVPEPKVKKIKKKIS